MRICIAPILALALAAAPSGFAQQQPKIKNVTPKYTSPASGAQMYQAYCASCHGLNGAGDGPAAPALKVAPADLTLLSRHNQGKFPAIQVQRAITGQSATPAHGSSAMPIWGDIFKSLNADKAVVTLRVNNLTDYISTMQREEGQ